jgi:TolB-like protein/DNA-binding winged helix-turn-helix (wHTH) protein/Tfp pilus assembly protein PilF
MTPRASEDSAIRFGGFELALKSGELRKDGVQVKLQNQPFRVLVFLASHAGELVTREELRQQIWQADTFVDFEHGLNFCIKQIRTALGDSAQSPVYIETLPRRGYRFIAPVTTPDEDRASGAGAGASEPTKPPTDVPRVEPSGDGSQIQSRPTRSLLWYGLSLALGGLLVGTGFLIWSRFNHEAVLSKRRVMLAVLPMENLSANPEQDYFSDGLTEEMIMQLGGLQPARLGVIARTSVMKYKQSGKDIGQIGSELSVDYVLEGSVRRQGDQLRIVSQLIRVFDQTHLWSASYDAAAGDALSVQKGVAERIARSLAIELLSSQENSAGSTRNPEAHDSYLKARYFWNKGDAANLGKSVAGFQQAIDQDPGYGLAYAGLADSYGLLPMMGTTPAGDAFPKSQAAALKSIELDDRIAEGHSALGSVKLWFERDWPGAEKEFQRAIELNPSYGRAHHDYAWLLVATGRAQEGIAQIKQAQELDPLSPLANSDVGWVYLFARHYDEAIDQIKRTLELEPRFNSARACLEEAYISRGMLAEAVASGKQAMSREGASTQDLAAIENIDQREVFNSIQRWRLNKRLASANGSDAGGGAYSIAQLYASLSQTDNALLWLEKAFEVRAPMVVFLRADPVWDGMQTDARFKDLVRRIGLPN